MLTLQKMCERYSRYKTEGIRFVAEVRADIATGCKQVSLDDIPLTHEEKIGYLVAYCVQCPKVPGFITLLTILVGVRELMEAERP